jgi:HSP20 family protein
MTGQSIEIRHGAAGSTQPGQALAASGWSYRPRIDVTEDANEFTILADMPGTTAEDIRINFESRNLTIHGTVRSRQPRDTEYLAHEYGVGDFDRELVLSEAVDTDRISAEYERGILTVHLPKSEEAKPRRIPVRPG